MNALIGLAIVALIIYNILYDATFMKIYLAIVGVYYVVTTVVFKTNDKMWKRRRIAMSSWNEPGEPTSYLPVEYDVTEWLKYLESLNKNSQGKKISMTYLVTKGLSAALSSSVDNIGRIAFGYFKCEEQIDIWVLADVNNGKDLGMVWFGFDRVTIFSTLIFSESSIVYLVFENPFAHIFYSSYDHKRTS